MAQQVWTAPAVAHLSVRLTSFLQGYLRDRARDVEIEDVVQEALLRECREELGVAVRLGPEVAAPEPDGWELANGARMRVFWGVLAEEGTTPRALQDHDLLAWLPLAGPGVRHLDWLPADRPIVAEVRRGAATAFSAGR